VNHDKLDYIQYYDSKSDLCLIDFNLPTLIVGWSYMMNTFKDNELIQNADILHHRIETNKLYWEFSFEESKSSHVTGIKSFIDNVFEFYFSQYKYINLDPIFFQINDDKELMDILPKEIDSFYVYKHDMIYILKDKQIWGLNLDIYTFFRFDIDKIVSNLEDRSFNPIHIDNDGYLYLKYNKKYGDFEKLKRYLIIILNNRIDVEKS
jgi:hypothetical protein